MLNTTFDRKINDQCKDGYVVPVEIAEQIAAGNALFDTVNEYRLQRIYGDEVWLKLESGGVSSKRLEASKVLEVCAGNGFLTYHLLRRTKPKYLVVNDISQTELQSNMKLISDSFDTNNIEWLLGDMHELDMDGQFDVIIGNSFLHHFYDVPKVMEKMARLLVPGGVFVSLHEPTPMATFVESGKAALLPLAGVFPRLMNDLVRERYRGAQSATDLWLFEMKKLRPLILEAGFSRVNSLPFNLLRPLCVTRFSLHLDEGHPRLSKNEIVRLEKAIRLDRRLARFVPSRFFGSVALFCHK